jgi:hypothetical protein
MDGQGLSGPAAILSGALGNMNTGTVHPNGPKVEKSVKE